ncbi:MAG: hypothetical protein ABS81_17810 [Pseudonocardia sp. SCN 72-86]|nr:MAG: hypothetical protein ABS81_17810 [Pseudonocardia sp. SCN 72-86]
MNMLSDVLTVLAGGAGIVLLLAMAALPLAVGRVDADSPLIPQPRRAPESLDAVVPQSVAA